MNCFERKTTLIYLPWTLTEAVFDGAFAWNVKFIAYVLPFINLHGRTVQPDTSNAWIVANSDPQSLYGVAVHIELIEQDKIVRMNNVNMIFFLSCLKIEVLQRNMKK